MANPTDHPWGAYLAARATCIAWMVSLGKSYAEIARDLSMDAEQVYLVYMGTLPDPATPTDLRVH